MKVKSLSHVQLLAIPWNAAYQAPPSMGFSRQKYWSGVPLPSPRQRYHIQMTARRRRWQPTSVLLPGKSHGRKSLVGCSPWGREESDTTERLHFHFSLFTFMHWRRKWQPTPVFLPGESQGQGSLVGCRLWGCTESDTTEAT